MKITIKELMRLGKEVSNTYKTATAVFGRSFVVYRTKETHLSGSGLVDVYETDSPSDLDSVLAALSHLAAIKSEIESTISRFNVDHNIHQTVNSIKHCKVMVANLDVITAKLRAVKPLAVRYEDGVKVTTEQIPTASEDDIRSLKETYDKEISHMQTHVDRLDLTEVTVSFDRKDINSIYKKLTAAVTHPNVW